MMNYSEGGYSLSDIAAATGNNRNNDGFGGDNGWWVILLLLALGGWGNGFGNGFGGGNNGGYGGGFNNDYAWLSNGQKEIMQNTNDGFNTLQLANQLTSVNSGIQNLSTQLCNCCADVNSNLCNGFAGVNATVNAGFAGAEQSANARQMANMQQAFSNQLSTLQGFNSINSQLCNASAENRLGQANLTSTILSENCADRQALSDGIRDVIASNTANTQAILDKLCQQEIDAKNETIANLRTQLNMADLRASQTAQNAFISQGFANEVDALYNRLNSCPINTIPVYGNQRIFTCNNNGCGCGCGNNF